MGAVAKWVDRHVGKRIRLRRALVGMTQENLAQAPELDLDRYASAKMGYCSILRSDSIPFRTDVGIL